MKTPEELNALREEIATLNKKLAELSDEELTEVTGGYVVKLPDGSYAVYDDDGGYVYPRDRKPYHDDPEFIDPFALRDAPDKQ